MASVDLDPDSPQVGTRVVLRQGLNVFTVPATATRSGPQKFDAIFEPDAVNETPRRGTAALRTTRGRGDVCVGCGGLISQRQEEQQHLVAP